MRAHRYSDLEAADTLTVISETYGDMPGYIDVTLRGRGQYRDLTAHCATDGYQSVNYAAVGTKSGPSYFRLIQVTETKGKTNTLELAVANDHQVISGYVPTDPELSPARFCKAGQYDTNVMYKYILNGMPIAALR